jgi:hypothetical protein
MKNKDGGNPHERAQCDAECYLATYSNSANDGHSMKLNPVKEALRSTLWGLMSIGPVRRAFQAIYTEYELHAKHRVETAVSSASQGVLQKGPFAGLRYPDVQPRGYMILASKYLGTFELELHNAVEQACKRQYGTILNVGSADGYYTVGFAMRVPGAKVIAWEMDPWWKDITRQVAELNKVRDRIELRDLCTVDEMRSVQATGRTLVFSDCEGFEMELLKPENLAHLGTYDIIVECHDLFVPNVTTTLIQRFSVTHDIEKIDARPRLLDDIDQDLVKRIPVRAIDLNRAFEEPRLYRQSWLVMTARG